MDNMTEMPRKLAIVAGSGELPPRVAAAALAQGREIFVVALEGFAEPASIGCFPHEFFRIGRVAAMLAAVRREGCQDVVMIGRVRRPTWFELRLDAATAKLAARIGKAMFAGDDGFLSAIVRILGEEGLRVIGAHDILDDLLGPEGVLTKAQPDEQAMSDIRHGFRVAKLLGQADVGQGCVVQHGFVLAVEAVEGTDAMLVRAGTLRREGPGGVLVKVAKPDQEKRADLPTIGLNTVRNAAAAGLRGLAFEANATILAQREACVAAADKAGLFMLGLDPATISEREHS